MSFLSPFLSLPPFCTQEKGLGTKRVLFNLWCGNLGTTFLYGDMKETVLRGTVGHWVDSLKTSPLCPKRVLRPLNWKWVRPRKRKRQRIPESYFLNRSGQKEQEKKARAKREEEAWVKKRSVHFVWVELFSAVVDWPLRSFCDERSSGESTIQLERRKRLCLSCLSTRKHITILLPYSSSCSISLSLTHSLSSNISVLLRWLMFPYTANHMQAFMRRYIIPSASLPYSTVNLQQACTKFDFACLQTCCKIVAKKLVDIGKFAGNLLRQTYLQTCLVKTLVSQH